ncbi:hypothetical protein [Hyalangium rubrum]|uniref:Uncharacterized protein n=1 Tax=Hyalangium rubrum TaxID=3103134 RepID=A0ABU5H124_9BACT|nr:hypothetical protein [Hyalangium sp. s54d21]MDY7226807.1 hypothetical protein [Hyalangium sp. s54d21]
MGIAERKAASQFEETTYPKLKKDIDTAAHFEVPVEVDWNSLALEGYDHLYEEAWPKVFFTPLIEALKAIGTDALGREVLRGTLKRVVIRNSKGVSSGSSMVHFQDGVLTLDHEPFSNVDYVQDRQEAIQKALESAPEDSASPDDTLAAFLSWNAKGVNATLQVLQRLFWRQQAGIPLVLPRMTLLLRSGRGVTGILREVLEDRHEGHSVLVHVPRESGMPYEDVVIVPVGTIEAISVHDVSAFGSLRRDAPPTPSLLQLRRRLAALETQLRGLVETPISVGLGPEVKATSATELRALGFLADRASEVMEALARDKVGKAALREKIQHIHLSVSDKGVKLTGHTLGLSTGARPVDWYTRGELEQAVQSAL